MGEGGSSRGATGLINGGGGAIGKQAVEFPQVLASKG